MTGSAAESLGAGVPSVGEVIAQKYVVEALVGRGGMGVVVAARHQQLGQAVAIKLLTVPPDEDRRDEAIARFLQEARAAARLRSDHVVKIYDVGQLDSGLPFMVMELLSGQDLGSMLDERGPLPEPEAVDYVLQACAGVAEAHQMGIVHRDLKPSNLFVTRRSDGLPLLKVLDFGISKQMNDPTSGEALPTFTNTRTLMGSPNYMSPEQIRDARRVDARADIWAMGIILQELMTNAPVFHGESFPGVCAAIVADPPMPVRTMRPDISVQLEAIINRCLEKDLNKRYQSIAALVAELVPLGLRQSGPQAIVYSSQPRISAPAVMPMNVTPQRTPQAMHFEPTVSVDSQNVLQRNGGTGNTLESARLSGGVNTNAAVSVSDSRVEIVPATAPKSAAKPLMWLGVGVVLSALVVAGIALRPQSPAAAPAASAPGPAPSAVTGPTPFTLSIDSEPSGAAVSEGGVLLGRTPFSLTMTLPEGASPRVFVITKDGYSPYVVRQAAGHGEVRVLAALSATAAPASSAAAPAVAAPAAPVKPVRTTVPPPKKSAAVPPPKPPSDIRLER